MATTGERQINVELGNVLRSLRRGGSWTVITEATRTLQSGAGLAPDVLITDPSGWPVVIEAEIAPAPSVEDDAFNRMYRQVEGTGHAIEASIALVYPAEFAALQGDELAAAIRGADDLRFALYTHRDEEEAERLPASGYISGDVRDLAMLIHRASIPVGRVDRLADLLATAVQNAAHHHGLNAIGGRIARILKQEDDEQRQTRMMAMTMIANALVFHETLARAGLPLDVDGSRRPVRALGEFRSFGRFDVDALLDEWDYVMTQNYCPIFSEASEMLRIMTADASAAVLDALWAAARELVKGGLASSHDLTGTVFQRLIADRKFLATFYTRPAAAALLAGIAVPRDRAPGGADWHDGDTLAALQIGDFACGTGTLLAAAYQRVSLLHELHAGDPAALHAPMMEHGLVGLDVIASAVHLTAAMLAAAQPGIPFRGERLLTMPYGGECSRADADDCECDCDAGIGSLALLSPHAQDRFWGRVPTGCKTTDEVRDVISQISHDSFDLVIMNPPFTRPTNHENYVPGANLPGYNAFDQCDADQRRMSDEVKALAKDGPSNDFAGLASHFTELAHRKVRADGTIALVLPLSAISGGSWSKMRDQLLEYDERIVITIAESGSTNRAFSADTGMAEALIIVRNATQRNATQRNATQRNARRSSCSTNSPRTSSKANSSPTRSAKCWPKAKSAASKTAPSAPPRSCSATTASAKPSTRRLRHRTRGRWSASQMRSSPNGRALSYGVTTSARGCRPRPRHCPSGRLAMLEKSAP